MPRLAAAMAGIALIAASFSISAVAAEPEGDDAWFQSHLGDFVDLYRQLHAHPELSYREVNTARRMAVELAKAGARVSGGVGQLGVVGVIENGRGSTVLVRADMDALPVKEETGLPFASVATTIDDEGNKVGVMHACGHDLHMANLVGTARWLADHRDRWSGTVVLVAQPAEERAGGAGRMLDDGLYERFPRPTFALAMHVAHDLEVGKVGYRSGPAMAGSTSVEILVRGKGGHGAMPDKTVDPIVLAAALVLDLQTIVSREIDPIDSAVVSVGSFHGGSKSNVIPDEVRMQLTLRAFRVEVRDQLVAGIRRRAEALAKAHSAPSPLVETAGAVPPTVNTPELVARVVPAFRKALGEGNVVQVEPTMLAEDFGLFGRGGVPTFMFRLGTLTPERLAKARAGGEPLPTLHSPRYRPEVEPAVRTGIRAMAAAVAELLPPQK